MANETITGSYRSEFSLPSMVRKIGISKTASDSELKGTLGDAITNLFEEKGLPRGLARRRANQIVDRIPKITPQAAETQVRKIIDHRQDVLNTREGVLKKIIQLPGVSEDGASMDAINAAQKIDMGNPRVTPLTQKTVLVSFSGSTPYTAFVVGSSKTAFRSSSAESSHFPIFGDDSYEETLDMGHDGYRVSPLGDAMTTPMQRVLSDEREAGELIHPVPELFETIKTIAVTMARAREDKGLTESGPVVAQDILSGVGLNVAARVFQTALVQKRDPYRDTEETLGPPFTRFWGDVIEKACDSIIQANTCLAPDPAPTLVQAAGACMAAELSMAMGTGKSIRNNVITVVDAITGWLTEDPDPDKKPTRHRKQRTKILSGILENMDPEMLGPIDTFTQALRLPRVGQRRMIFYDNGHRGDSDHETYSKPLELVVHNGKKIKHIEY